jgi:hypothetical protein
MEELNTNASWAYYVHICLSDLEVIKYCEHSTPAVETGISQLKLSTLHCHSDFNCYISKKAKL